MKYYSIIAADSPEGTLIILILILVIALVIVQSSINRSAKKKREQDLIGDQRNELELQRLQVRQRLENLHEHLKTAGGENLTDLPFEDVNALIENMRDFPGIRDELSPEDYAVREKLYRIALTDRNLQAGLQAALLSQLASGQPTASAAGSGQSNLARNAAMLGGVAALQKLNQIEENTEDVSEGFGFD